MNWNTCTDHQVNGLEQVAQVCEVNKEEFRVGRSGSIRHQDGQEESG